MGLTGPSSLENVHRTFSRALGPPKGKARDGRAIDSEIDLIRQRFALPPPISLTGLFSLENVHWTFSRALGPPKGKAGIDERQKKAFPFGEGGPP